MMLWRERATDVHTCTVYLTFIISVSRYIISVGALRAVAVFTDTEQV